MYLLAAQVICAVFCCWSAVMAWRSRASVEAFLRIAGATGVGLMAFALAALGGA